MPIPKGLKIILNDNKESSSIKFSMLIILISEKKLSSIIIRSVLDVKKNIPYRNASTLKITTNNSTTLKILLFIIYHHLNILKFILIYDNIIKESWYKMNKKAKKIATWVMLLLMLGSVVASIVVYAII